MYPEYRKLSNNKSFYKIHSENSFEELQLIGTSVMRMTVNATKYPEIIRIKDMIDCKPPFEMSTAEEFLKQIDT
jgi:hypothetical protein|tara:strand:+ start:33 stop:254 length:222 start_codon:yes stop_codon:yes gene_type:complete